jgi:hypothetical protein
MRVGSEQSHLVAMLVALVAAVFAIAGCSANDVSSRPSGSGGASSGGGPSSGGAGGSGAWGGSGGWGGTSGAGGDGGGSGTNGLPCNVKTVVEARCATCHGAPPAFGAPMSLVTWQDFQRPSPKDASMRNASNASARLLVRLR